MEIEPVDIQRILQWFHAVEDLNQAYLYSDDRLLAERLEEAKSLETQQVSNHKAPGNLSVGDYVFASRWSDCSPGDPWAVGHVSFVGPDFVVVGDVSQRKWPRAMRITTEQGHRIVKEFPGMEQEPQDYGAVARIFGVA